MSTTCHYRYEIVLSDGADNSAIDGDHASRKQDAFARGEQWLKGYRGEEKSRLCVAVYDRMARIGAPYEWRYVSGRANGAGWVVTKLRAAETTA